MFNEDTLVEELSDGTPSQSIVDQKDGLRTVASEDAPTAPYGKIAPSDLCEEPTQEIPVESFLETGERVIAERREQEQRLLEMERMSSTTRPTVNMRRLKRPASNL